VAVKGHGVSFNVSDKNDGDGDGKEPIQRAMFYDNTHYAERDSDAYATHASLHEQQAALTFFTLQPTSSSLPYATRRDSQV
jgi:hypothetical protein